MDQLWAPWRLAYIASAKKTTDADPCFICRAGAEADDRRNLVAQRTAKSLVLLNRFPYNNGHLLVAPRAHKGKLGELESQEVVELQHTLAHLVEVLDELIQPDGYNIGLNLGRVAGAGLPGHLHWHIVPRWNGDTNFMPVLAEVKVIAQSLDSFWEMLVHRLGSNRG